MAILLEAAVNNTRRKCKEIASLCVGMFMKAIDMLLLAAFTCILALGGCIMGTIAGGIKGQTTEAGILEGAGKGAVTGAIAALEMLDPLPLDHHHQPLSKVAILSNLFNGKVLMEWIYPAYQWHIGYPETIYRELYDLYDVKGVPGLSHSLIQNLPLYQFNLSRMSKFYNDTCCPICFQEFEDGGLVRVLPKCHHFFHFECIDKWLIQQGSCPMCRTHVSNHFDGF